jgi:protein phosphatase
MKAFGISDIGPTRPNNEDVFLSRPEMGLFALADGVGGHRAGEVAAYEAIRALSEAIEGYPDSISEKELFLAFDASNRWVYQMGRGSFALEGMGTTLTCLLIRKERSFFAHVGDSRLYRFRQGRLRLLTQDHHIIRDGKKKLSRIIGLPTPTLPDVSPLQVMAGDRFLLSSDGLEQLSIQEIENILLTSPSKEEAGKNLIDRAKLLGSRDNMTALLVEIDEDLFR